MSCLIFVLRIAVQCCAVLCHVVSCRDVLYCAAPCVLICVELCYVVLYRTVCVELCCVVLSCLVSSRPILSCLFCLVLYCIFFCLLCCAVLCCLVSRCVALCCSVPVCHDAKSCVTRGAKKYESIKLVIYSMTGESSVGGWVDLL